MNGWEDEWMGGWIEGWMDGWIDRRGADGWKQGEGRDERKRSREGARTGNLCKHFPFGNIEPTNLCRILYEG